MATNEPKYQRVKLYIKELIREGVICNGQMLPSEYELMEMFAVSRHTVRQAFGELAKEGWVYKEQGRGTFANYNKNIDHKGIIGVITTYISDYIFPHIISGIEEVLAKGGYVLALANTNNNKEKEAQHIMNFMEQNIVGLIIEPTRSAEENTNLHLLKEVESRDIKTIFINAAYPDYDSPYIIMDDVKGGFTATQHLLQTGHRKIAGIFKKDDLQGLKREEGYKKALKSFNITPDESIIGHYGTESKGTYPYIFAQKLVESRERPDAIVCYNDEIAIKVVQAIRDRGLEIPDDISIIGYDDSALALASDIKLTTIRHPKKQMGEQAAHYLIEMLENNIHKPVMTYEPELIVRSSCKSL
ncbi:MAG TPA: GntR family transcriptional regulator [Clostridiales bacterium]|nr:GntR family transcriptional regulator [Clostridiales bacterium]